jgi:hypothetical protein
MMAEESAVWSMSNAELLAAARDLVRRSQNLEARLLVHLAEIDERKLYLDCGFPSMFAYCVSELHLSEDAAYNRIGGARAGRRFPAALDAIRDGRVHLWGMRLLAPHFTEANHRELIALAAGKTKREIEEVLASLAPRAPVASMIRSVPERTAMTGGAPLTAVQFAPASDPPSATAAMPDVPLSSAPASVPPSAAPPRIGPTVVPLAAQTYKVQFTAGRSFRDKLCQAQDLMRHRVPDGNLETIFEAALELLIDQVKKERFALGCTPRGGGGDGGGDGHGDLTGGATGADKTAAATNGHAATIAKGFARSEAGPATVASTSVPAPARSDTPVSVPAGTKAEDGKRQPTKSSDNEVGKLVSRHVPNAVRRALYSRDGGRCTFVDEKGRRCTATGHLEVDHVDGFAETRSHDIARLRMLCRAHNQREAEKRYGKAFMESARKSRKAPSTRSGTSPATSSAGPSVDVPRKARRP